MTVKSNSEYLNSKVGEISNALSRDVGRGGMDSYASTTRCPSSEPSVIETFLNSCETLFSKMSENMALISAIGEGWETMDNIMKGYAKELNMEVTSKQATIVRPHTFEDKSNIFTDYNEIEAIFGTAKIENDKKGTTGGSGGTSHKKTDNGSDSVTLNPPKDSKHDTSTTSDSMENVPKDDFVNVEEQTIKRENSSVAANEPVNDNKEDRVIDGGSTSRDKEVVKNLSNSVSASGVDVISNENTPKERKSSILGAAAIIGGAGLSGISTYKTGKKIREEKKDGDEDESNKF